MTERAEPMISYAQNFEDVILWRALKDVPNGFYIDIGAGHPVADSVTMHFYEHGWRGINVEPDPRLFAELARSRPRDANFECAAGDPDRSGDVTTIHIADHPGLSTIDSAVAERHRADGQGLTAHRIGVKSLNTIVAEANHNGPVHFLKIDAEGSELDVVRGADWTALRPWIIVTETIVDAGAGLSGTADPTGTASPDVASILAQAGYTPVYFDGLNRFFVAAEHRSLADRLSIPPNVFDHFIGFRESQCIHDRDELRRQAEDAEQRAIRINEDASAMIRELTVTITKLDAELRASSEWGAALERRILEIQESFRWRVLHPRSGRDTSCWPEND